jgi:hypothetical protein
MFSCTDENCFDCLKSMCYAVITTTFIFLIESVIKKYLNVGLHFITKRQSEVTDAVRNKLTKLILFKGQ